LEEQISRLKSEIERCKLEIDRKKGANKKHLEETKRLHSSLVDLTTALEELNEQSRDKSGELQLAHDQLQEYHKIKDDAETRTAKLRDENEILDKELIVNVEARKNLEENMQQLRKLVDEISSMENELQTSLDMIRNSITMHKDEISCLHEEHDTIVKERQSSGLVPNQNLLSPDRVLVRINFLLHGRC
jgi:structural maintenance of chromosome 1